MALALREVVTLLQLWTTLSLFLCLWTSVGESLTILAMQRREGLRAFARHHMFASSDGVDAILGSSFSAFGNASIDFASRIARREVIGFYESHRLLWKSYTLPMPISESSADFRSGLQSRCERFEALIES